jgi:hypothetical protein
MTTRSRVLTDQLRQTAIRWTGFDGDGFGGRTFDEGVEIAVRWEDRAELFLDPQGRQSTSRAVIFVSCNVQVGDYLMLGELLDLSSGEEQPMDRVDAYEVKAVATTPSLQCDRFVRQVWL